LQRERVARFVSGLISLLLFAPGTGMALEDAGLEVVSAGRLPSVLRDGLADLGICGMDVDVIAVHLAISNQGASPLVMGRATPVRCTAVIEGKRAGAPIALPGVFVQPFALRDSTVARLESPWASWHNLGDDKNPELGTHVYLPLAGLELTVPAGGRCEFCVVLPLAGNARSYRIEVGALRPADVVSSGIVDSDSWRAHMQAIFGPGGGARNFIPRKASPEALTSDGLPFLTMGGLKWRARKGASGGFGLVYFRRVGPNALPFGGAGQFATETLLPEWVPPAPTTGGD